MKQKRKLTMPTLKENAVINAGIKTDPDAFELDENFFKHAKRGRGLQKAPTKEAVSIRLDADVLSYYRESGKGWQSRLNADLREKIDKKAA